MTIDKFYDNKGEYLIYRVIENFDTLSTKEIISTVKNWGATTFDNSNDVIVVEAKDQISYTYIAKGKRIMNWFIRLSIQIKDNKVRVSFYDDGNAPFLATNPKTYNFTCYFKGNGACLKSQNDDLVALRQSCIDLTTKLIGAIKGEKDSSDSSW
ncbi:MAG: hypothetical protein RR034_04090 [Bacteroidales bacterium]